MSDVTWTQRSTWNVHLAAPIRGARGRGTAPRTSSVDVKKLHKRGFTTRAFHNSRERPRRLETRVGPTCGHRDIFSPGESSLSPRKKRLVVGGKPSTPSLLQTIPATDTTHGAPKHMFTDCLKQVTRGWTPSAAFLTPTSAVWEPGRSDSAQRRSSRLHSLQEDKRFFFFFFLHPSHGVRLCDCNDGFLLRLLHTRQRRSQQAAHARLCPQERVEMEKHRHILRAQLHYRCMGSDVVCPAENISNCTLE